MNLKIISAGAGSGKTYRLTQEMVSLLGGREVRASGIIATTFTNKAAAELQERVRVKLLEEGLVAEANDLGNALIGTVHGLGVKLLKRFAFEAGVSPEVDIIADEDQQFMFNQSLATVLTNDRVHKMERLSEQLGLRKSTYNSTDWRKVLKDLTEVARANNFTAEILQKSKKQSFDTFSTFLEQPKDWSSEQWNQQLQVHLAEAVARLEGNADSTKVTANGIQTIKGFQAELKTRGHLYWHQWVKIGKTKVGAKSREDLQDLAAFVNKHLAHPLFHQDIKAFIDGIYDLAVEAIGEFNRYKKSRGLIDYTDMEVLVNQLLDQEIVRTTLDQEIDLLMVDEFQDTSPIQLEIFLKLSKLAKHSIWVGDPKQSIYGFRGAEPALMQAIIARQGGLKKENILPYSWRSRESIVHATNAIFTKAFKEMPVEQVALSPKRLQKATSDSANQTDEPDEQGNAFIQWHFQFDGEGRKPGGRWVDHCIAEQISTFLNQKPLILPKGTQEYRPIEPGDVAILCRSNKKCLDMAATLHQAGLKAAISRAGLLQKAESKLILACLKYILNKNDALSIAEILVLAVDLKIEEVIEDRMAFLASNDDPLVKSRWGSDHSFMIRLNALRSQVVELSSAEILTLLLEELDLRRIIVSWGRAEQRLSNIDQIVKFSFKYEENCSRLHSAASLGGFLLWLSELDNKEEDFQGAGEHRDAVNVLTYHKSKGLEYPVVICHGLEGKLRDDVWGLSIVAEKDEVDLDHLLANRWLRFWVNPYADQYRNTPLAAKIDTSTVKKAKRKSALEEEARLMYVGITRARDYLIFPTYHNNAKWLNRVYFEGKEDQELLDPKSDLSPLEWEGKLIPVHVDINHYPASFSHGDIQLNQQFSLTVPVGRKEHLPYLMDESKLSAGMELSLNEYGIPITLPEVQERQLAGKAITAFLNAEKESLTKEQRLELGQTLIENYQVDGMLEPEQLDLVYTNFGRWLNLSHSVKNKYLHFPIQLHEQGQVYDTTVDCLLETNVGCSALIHSSFTGLPKVLKKKAKEMSGRMMAIKKSIQSLYDQQPVKLYIHFPCAGCVVEIKVK